MRMSGSMLIRSMWLVLAVAVPLASAEVAAAGRLDRLDMGPKVGATIPHSLTVRDQNDQYRNFKSLARRRGLIVLFSRSLDW